MDKWTKERVVENGQKLDKLTKERDNVDKMDKKLMHFYGRNIYEHGPRN
jgi:hypothetical protein